MVRIKKIMQQCHSALRNLRFARALSSVSKPNLITKQINDSDEDTDEPLTFEYDCLDCEPFAKNLTRHIEMHSAQEKEAFVLSLNAPFGEGKTTFIHMWKDMLEKRGTKCVYINAWQHDYLDDPIFPILGAVLKQLPDDNRTRSKRLKLEDAVLAILLGINAVAQSQIGVDIAGSVLAYKGIRSMFKRGKLDITDDERLSILKQEKIHHLQKRLRKYITAVPGGRIVVFVDELDRARPDFSVKYIETIKHIFPVKKLCFVLSVDRGQLEKSVRQIYGNIDFDNYYSKFITAEAKLPKTETRNLDRYLRRLNRQYLDPLRKFNIFSLQDTEIDLHGNLACLCNTFGLSARQIEHLFRKFTHFIATDSQKFKSGLMSENWALASMFLITLSIADRNMYLRFGAGQVHLAPDHEELYKLIYKIQNAPAFKQYYRHNPHGIRLEKIILAFLLQKSCQRLVTSIYSECIRYHPTEDSDKIIRELTSIALGDFFSSEVAISGSVFQIIYEKYEQWQTITT